MVMLFGSRWTNAELVDLVVPVLMASTGFLSESPRVWFSSLAACYAVIAGSVLSGAAAMDFVAARCGTRIQPGERKQPELWVSEALETARSCWIACCLTAWPVMRARLGYELAITWELGGLRGFLIVCLQGVAAVLALDFWLYWKHRFLHSRWLFGFHKKHHTFRDPTAFASFSVSPIESIVSYWMIPLMCIPWKVIYAPLNILLVVWFIVLNFYLHCGVTFEWAEWLLPKLWMDSSKFHNAHHFHTRANFGEALFLWDHLMKTRVEDMQAERKQRLADVNKEH